MINARDIFVDGSNGNDQNSGSAWSTAKKTIKSAYYAASDGDSVHVANGTYPGFYIDGNKSVLIIGD